MKVSRFGQKIKRRSGISQLMVDMGEGLKAGEDVLMLGGGNPSHIPEVDEVFRQMYERASCERRGRSSGRSGIMTRRRVTRNLLRQSADCCGRNAGGISSRAISLLRRAVSRRFSYSSISSRASLKTAQKRKYCFRLPPNTPATVMLVSLTGYLSPTGPISRHIDEHTFKYHVDFDRLKVDEDIGAICISRPTNPTANVLTDAEVAKLDSLARAKGIPLIIDNAYGSPFPNIIFTEARPLWNENTIVCMSLSKFGLPATRTGIVIAT